MLSRLHQRAVEMRKRPTWAEKKMWAALRDEHLDGFKFRRQHRIGRYLRDLYCFAARLAIEIDGPVHETQVNQDAERQEFLESYGSRVLRFTNHDVVNNLPAVLRQIRQALKSVKL